MPLKITLDPTIINKLRLTYTDLEIRVMFKTSTVSINQQCWTRKKNWIPFIQRNMVIKKWKPMVYKEVINDRKLEKRSWTDVYPEKKQKKWEWEIIRIWENPFSAFYDKLVK